jgi:RNA polymerase sigma-70 factor (ECF subfamily)
LVANQAALARVYEERYVDFVRVATAVTGKEAVGVDAVQEAFARALANLGAYRGEAPLAGWVWRIVVNAALDARGRIGEGSEGPPAAESVSNGHSADEIGVRQWVSLLPERQRLAVFLRYYADLDYASIASALEIEVGTVSATHVE